MRSRRYIVIFSVVLISAVLACISAKAGNPVCNYCHHEIDSGQYIQAGNKYYHPDHFLCDYCNRPIGETKFILVGNKKYHADCYEENLAPRCAYCGKSLGRNFVRYEGKDYHKSCYEQHVAVRCSLCGKIIEGEYLVDYWGNKYHSYHKDSIPGCDFCGRLFSDPRAGGGESFGENHHICNMCKRTAVKNLKNAEALLLDIRHKLAEKGIIIRSNDIELELVSEETLMKLSHSERADKFGLTKYETESFGGMPFSREFKIYILKGLPLMYYYSTAAHELMHVWVYLNSPEDIEAQLNEGSCNYAAKLILDMQDDPLAAYVLENLERNPDPVYGDGYRRVEKLVKNRGIKYWLEHIAFDPEFPIGY